MNKITKICLCGSVCVVLIYAFLPSLAENAISTKALRNYAEKTLIWCGDRGAAALLRQTNRDRLLLNDLQKICTEANKTDASAGRFVSGIKDINETGIDGMTMLHVASEVGAERIVKLLLAQGAEVDGKNSAGKTPLHLASGCMNVEGSPGLVAKALLEKGASVEGQDPRGSLPLTAAVGTHNSPVLKQLIKYNCDVKQKFRGNTMIHLALVSFPKTDISIAGTDTVRLLIQAGVNVNETDPAGRTALHLAAQRNATAIIKELISEGVNVNDTNSFSETPLHVASQYGKVEAIKELINLGANINAKTSQGKTPLHYAVSSRSVESLQTLIDNNANVNATTNKNDTPLDLARYLRNCEIMISPLKSAGGKTSLELMKQNP